jgi:bisphosphoglycerate-dependent phosphoglycerate mutase family 1
VGARNQGLAPQRAALWRLTGLDKAETAAKHGDEQVKVWRRSFDIPPPVLEAGSEFDLASDPRYAGIPPATESLKDTIARVLPAYEELIVPALKAGETVIVSAHGNSLRAGQAPVGHFRCRYHRPGNPHRPADRL